MNQVTNLIQYKNLTEEQKADFDFSSYTYEYQDDLIWCRSTVNEVGFHDNHRVYRLVIEPDKWYYTECNLNGIGVNLGGVIIDNPITAPLDGYTILRPAKPSEIPKPESLEDRVKAVCLDYEVVMLEWRDNILRFSKFNCDHWHINAQSMRGFHKYVYFDGSEFYTCGEPTDEVDDKAVHPCAVLFEKATR